MLDQLHAADPRDAPTLETLAARYLGDHQRWTALQSYNKVQDPLRLRPGSVLEIPTRLLRADQSMCRRTEHGQQRQYAQVKTERLTEGKGGMIKQAQWPDRAHKTSKYRQANQ